MSQDVFFIHKGKKFIRFPFSELLYVKAAKSYCTLALSDGRKITLARPLSKLEKDLPPVLFLRIHRSFVVAISAITSFGNSWVMVEKDRLAMCQKKYECLRSRVIILSENKKPQKGKVLPLMAGFNEMVIEDNSKEAQAII